MKIATVKDVAKKAGVSAMTVSRVLNNTGSVSDVTRNRVMEAAKELNYYKNTVARGLRVNETKTIGAVLSDSSELVISQVLRGIMDGADQYDYSVISANTDRSIETEKKAVETLVRKHIDGLIMVAPMSYAQDEIGWLKELGIPVVILMRTTEAVTLDTVLNDNVDGGYQVVEHLCKQGCKTFFFLSLKYSASGRGRMEGYRKALAEYGIPDENIYIEGISQYAEAGYKKTVECIERIRQYDALVCGCDAVALGAMRALHENRVNVPEDIKVIGYDGIDLCKYLTIPLSTVKQPFYEIGKTGMEVMMQRIQDPERPLINISYKGTLIPRESTRAD